MSAIHRAIGAAAALFLAVGAGCGGPGSPAASYVDPAVTTFYSLGFLGAAGHGLTRTLMIPDPQDPAQSVATGGIVLREIDAASPLKAQGLAVGDVLFRVETDLLPIKEDLSLDLLTRVESAISGSKKQIEIGYWRAGTVKTASLPLDLPSLEVGFPYQVERFSRAARSGLEFLKRSQGADGSFPAPRENANARIAVTAAAGAAFVAAEGDLKAGPHAPTVASCVKFLSQAVGDATSPWAAAEAAVFLSELGARNGDEDLSKLLARCVQRVESTQTEEGCWLTPQGADALKPAEKVLLTLPCLAALGMAERAGAKVNSEVVARACVFVKKHTNEGKPGFSKDPSFDPRMAVGQFAGTLAALRAVSCDKTDAFVKSLELYYLEHGKELAQAPAAVPSFLYWSALVSRQNGVPGWTKFFMDHRVFLVSLQKPDGSFVSLPQKRNLPFYGEVEGVGWATAHGVRVCLLQNDAPPALIAKETYLANRPRDSAGKRLEASAAGPGPGDGAQVITSPQELIEMMKKMGIPEDDPQVKQMLDMMKGAGAQDGAKEGDKPKKDKKPKDKKKDE